MLSTDDDSGCVAGGLPSGTLPVPPTADMARQPTDGDPQRRNSRLGVQVRVDAAKTSISSANES
jgi:hypothetical protein